MSINYRIHQWLICLKSFQLQSLFFWCICSILIIRISSRKFKRKKETVVIAAAAHDDDDALCCIDIVPCQIDYGDRCLLQDYFFFFWGALDTPKQSPIVSVVNVDVVVFSCDDHL